jgi:hypothetical protein
VGAVTAAKCAGHVAGHLVTPLPAFVKNLHLCAAGKGDCCEGGAGANLENDKCCLCQVRAQAECLLGWLRHAGREAGVASKRFAEREEEIWAREGKTQEIGRHERKVVRRGMFLLER